MDYSLKLDFMDDDCDIEGFPEEINYKRHTCIICGRKRYEHYMKPVLSSSWACKDKYYFQYCCEHEEIKQAQEIIDMLKKFKHIKRLHIFGK